MHEIELIFFLIAYDFNTTIYTAVTGGTDQTVKLWRIYALRDWKETGSSRLVPNGQQVVHNLKTENLRLKIRTEYFLFEFKK